MTSKKAKRAAKKKPRQEYKNARMWPETLRRFQNQAFLQDKKLPKFFDDLSKRGVKVRTLPGV